MREVPGVSPSGHCVSTPSKGRHERRPRHSLHPLFLAEMALRARTGATASGSSDERPETYFRDNQWVLALAWLPSASESLKHPPASTASTSTGETAVEGPADADACAEVRSTATAGGGPRGGGLVRLFGEIVLEMANLVYARVAKFERQLNTMGAQEGPTMRAILDVALAALGFGGSLATLDAGVGLLMRLETASLLARDGGRRFSCLSHLWRGPRTPRRLVSADRPIFDAIDVSTAVQRSQMASLVLLPSDRSVRLWTLPAPGQTWINRQNALYPDVLVVGPWQELVPLPPASPSTRPRELKESPNLNVDRRRLGGLNVDGGRVTKLRGMACGCVPPRCHPQSTGGLLPPGWMGDVVELLAQVWMLARACCAHALLPPDILGELNLAVAVEHERASPGFSRRADSAGTASPPTVRRRRKRSAKRRCRPFSRTTYRSASSKSRPKTSAPSSRQCSNRPKPSRQRRPKWKRNGPTVPLFPSVRRRPKTKSGTALPTPPSRARAKRARLLLILLSAGTVLPRPPSRARAKSASLLLILLSPRRALRGRFCVLVGGISDRGGRRFEAAWARIIDQMGSRPGRRRTDSASRDLIRGVGIVFAAGVVIGAGMAGVFWAGGGIVRGGGHQRAGGTGQWTRDQKMCCSRIPGDVRLSRPHSRRSDRPHGRTV